MIKQDRWIGLFVLLMITFFILIGFLAGFLIALLAGVIFYNGGVIMINYKEVKKHGRH